MSPTKIRLLTAFLLPFATADALAYEIQTGFSEGCHEVISARAADESFSDRFSIGDEVTIPEDDNYEAISESILVELGIEWNSPKERYLLTSLVVGSRWPDTRGYVFTNSAEIRGAHVESDEQYNHALRKPTDDYEEGNQRAVEGARATIQRQLDTAAALLDGPQEQQNMKRTVFVEYYGEVELTLWGPAFHLGFAAHTLQDSFSHTIRSEDLTTILHVMNFAEATRGELEAERDGLAHSAAMDRCNEDASEIAEVAERATREMFTAFYRSTREGQPSALPEVMDKWMTYEAGCDFDNDFCESEWLPIAETDPAKPFFQSIFGCSTGPHAPSTPTASFLALVGLVVAWRRRRHDRRS